MGVFWVSQFWLRATMCFQRPRKTPNANVCRYNEQNVLCMLVFVRVRVCVCVCVHIVLRQLCKYFKCRFRPKCTPGKPPAFPPHFSQPPFIMTSNYVNTHMYVAAFVSVFCLYCFYTQISGIFNL